MNIYVGTYSKYNDGSLFGAWVDPSDYDKETFWEFCAELHSDESDPEFMFQDWEDIPEQFIGESHLSNEFWEYLEFLDETHLDREVVDAGLSLEIPLDKIEEAYYGSYDSDTELAEEYIDGTGMLSDLDESLHCYFDYAGFGRALSYDFSEEAGHYFHNSW